VQQSLFYFTVLLAKCTTVLLEPAYLGSAGQRAVKQLLLLAAKLQCVNMLTVKVCCESTMNQVSNAYHGDTTGMVPN